MTGHPRVVSPARFRRSLRPRPRLRCCAGRACRPASWRPTTLARRSTPERSRLQH